MCGRTIEPGLLSCDAHLMEHIQGSVACISDSDVLAMKMWNSVNPDMAL
jgi:hypothetical protein